MTAARSLPRYDARAAGAKCDECPLNKGVVVPPTAAKKALKFIVVAMEPGRMEEMARAPLVGPTGKLMNKVLGKAGLDRDNAHLTNAMLCRCPDDDEEKRRKAQACCAPRLARELTPLSKEVPILAMGKWAAVATLGQRQILKVRGFVWKAPVIEDKKVAAWRRKAVKSRVERRRQRYLDEANVLEARKAYEGRTVFPTVHPAFVMRDEKWGPALVVDIKRMSRWMRGGGKLELADERPYIVVNTAAKLKAAMRSLAETISFDIETDGTDPTSCGLVCFSVSDGKKPSIVAFPWIPEMAPVLHEALQKRVVVTHNGPAFDEIRIALEGVLFKRKEDTLIAHHAIAAHLPQRLDHVASMFIDVGPWKLAAKGGDSTTGEKGFGPVMAAAKGDPESIRKLVHYSAADARVQIEIWLAMSAADLSSEMHVYRQDMISAATCRRMQVRGILINESRREEIATFLRTRIDSLLADMRKVTGKPDFNPNRPIEVRKVLFGRFKAPILAVTAKGYRSTAGAVLESLRKNTETKYGIFADLIMRWREASKLLSTFVEGVDVGADGRVHPNWRSFGTVSGRFACIAQGTLIETMRDVSAAPKGVPIEDVQVGDYAYCFVNGKLALRKVLDVYSAGRKAVVRVRWRGTAKKHFGYVDLTADHRVLKTNGEWIAAGDLEPHDRIMALSRDVSHGYARLYPTGVGTAIRENRFVYTHMTGESPEHVHHVNDNKLDNRFSNLVGMTNSEHGREHGARPSPQLIEKRRENARRLYAEGRGVKPLRGENHPDWLKLTKEEIEEALRVNDWAITKTARALGHDFDSFKRHVKLAGIDLEELKRKNRAGRIEQLRAMAAHARETRHRGGVPNNHEVLGVEKLPGKVMTYDLAVEEAENFIAGELCVHNCRRPNLMNLPRNDEVNIRSMYVARDGYVFVYFDLSQAEMRGAAFLSGDEKFIAEILTGDPYLARAKVLFPQQGQLFEGDGGQLDKIEKGLRKGLRQISKKASLAANYLVVAANLLPKLLADPDMRGPQSKFLKLDRIEMALDKIHGTYRRYFEYVEENIELCKRQGHFRTGLLGRARWLGFYPKPQDVANGPIQMIIADIMNDRLPQVEDKLPEGDGLVAQIHDACIFEVKIAHLSRVAGNGWKKYDDGKWRCGDGWSKDDDGVWKQAKGFSSQPSDGLIQDTWTPPVRLRNGREFMMPVEIKVAESWGSL